MRLLHYDMPWVTKTKSLVDLLRKQFLVHQSWPLSPPNHCTQATILMFLTLSLFFSAFIWNGLFTEWYFNTAQLNKEWALILPWNLFLNPRMKKKHPGRRWQFCNTERKKGLLFDKLFLHFIESTTSLI